MIIIIFLILSSVCFGQIQKHHLQVLARKNVDYTLWYVDRDATGGADGTSWTDAEVSLAAVFANAIGARDTIYMSGGADSTTYPSQSIYEKGTREGWVTIAPSWESGHDGDVYFVNKTTAAAHCLQIYKSNRIKVTGMTFIQEAEYSVGNKMAIEIYADSVTIDNSSITTNGYCGPIVIGESYYISITNNTIQTLQNNTTLDQDGIYANNGSGGHVITGNKMYLRGDGYLPHIDFIQYGTAEGSVNNYQSVIADNLFWMSSDSASSGSAGAIRFADDQLSHRLLLYNNIIVMAAGHMDGVIAENDADSVNLSLRMYNNIIISTSPTALGGTCVRTLRADTLIMRNNIIMYDSIGYGLVSILPGKEIGAIDSVDIDYNHYWNNGSSIQFLQNSNTKTWAEWKAYGIEANSDTGSVSFASIYGTTIADYVTSAGRDVGVDLSAIFTTDINGYVRPYNSVWDIGAIEYNP